MGAPKKQEKEKQKRIDIGKNTCPVRVGDIVDYYYNGLEIIDLIFIYLNYKNFGVLYYHLYVKQC